MEETAASIQSDLNTGTKDFQVYYVPEGGIMTPVRTRFIFSLFTDHVFELGIFCCMLICVLICIDLVTMMGYGSRVLLTRTPMSVSHQSSLNL